MSVKQSIVANPNLKWALRPLRCLKSIMRQIRLRSTTLTAMRKGIVSEKPKIYYIGIPAHANLGDLAQGICIRRWLKKHYSEYYVVEIETNALVNTRFTLLGKLKKCFNEKQDFIVFQSGYTTTDLGGFADIVHQAVMNVLPDSRVLMMPQTIFFKNKERKELCAKTYNAQKRMLFLARDTVSFEMAKEMFPDIEKRCYPDIVTTLIGTVESNQRRDGICFCLRNDGEKYYSDDELQVLIEKCNSIADVKRLDTTKSGNVKAVVTAAEKYIYSEIEEYSKYRVMITDRYHGTILSLVAGTPVIIIKTTDHKVTTGADWFKGIYDDHVFLAEDLNDAFEIAEKIYKRNEYPILEPYFEKEYYDKLPGLFKETVK